jgi:hypothetical protein
MCVFLKDKRSPIKGTNDHQYSLEEKKKEFWILYAWINILYSMIDERKTFLISIEEDRE